MNFQGSPDQLPQFEELERREVFAGTGADGAIAAAAALPPPTPIAKPAPVAKAQTISLDKAKAATAAATQVLTKATAAHVAAQADIKKKQSAAASAKAKAQAASSAKAKSAADAAAKAQAAATAAAKAKAAASGTAARATADAQAKAAAQAAQAAQAAAERQAKIQAQAAAQAAAAAKAQAESQARADAAAKAKTQAEADRQKRLAAQRAAEAASKAAAQAAADAQAQARAQAAAQAEADRQKRLAQQTKGNTGSGGSTGTGGSAGGGTGGNTTAGSGTGGSGTGGSTKTTGGGGGSGTSGTGGTGTGGSGTGGSGSGGSTTTLPNSFAFGPSGLQGVTYNGTTLYDATWGTDYGTRLMSLDIERNGVVTSNKENAVYAWNATTKTAILTTSVCVITIKYDNTDPVRLNATVNVQNTTTDAIIRGWNVFLMTVRFPTQPTFTNDAVQFNREQPSAPTVDFGAGTLAFVNNTTGSPIATGVMTWGSGTSARNEYVLRLGTGAFQGQSQNWPLLDKRIPAGQTDTYKYSVRVGAKGKTAQQLAPDVFNDWENDHPSSLKWNDRRPIAQLVMFNNGGVPTSKVNLKAGDATAQFRAAALQYADDSIRRMKAANAQGMIVWDMEGWDQPRATFVGDPRQTAIMQPAMDAVADDFFQKFRDAGLRVGVCIRPTQVRWDAQGAYQADVADPAAEIQAKVQYCKQRWGTTLFYVDSTNEFHPEWVEPVARANPDCLFIPENPNTSTYAYGAPYLDGRFQGLGAPDKTLAAYPDAFGCVSVGDIDTNSKVDALTTTIQRGNIILYHGWGDLPTGVARAISNAGVPLIRTPSPGATINTGTGGTGSGNKTNRLRLFSDTATTTSSKDDLRQLLGSIYSASSKRAA